MVRRRPRRKSGPGLGWSGFGGALLLLLAVASGGALAYFYFSAPARPILDARSLCPVNGPQGITVVLVDTTDDFEPALRRALQRESGTVLVAALDPQVITTRGTLDAITQSALKSQA